MKVKSLGVAILLTFGFSLFTVSEKESVNTAGSNASGSEGSVTYSVGQLVFQTFTATNLSVLEGVQQPYEISGLTGIEEIQGINLSVSVYPNPFTDCLALSINEFGVSNFSY